MEKRLCLLWQNTETRSWYHVGNLIQKEDSTFSFSYEHRNKERGLEEALEVGYLSHPAFPDLFKTYYSEKLFSAFSRRLPNRSRKDYEYFFEIFDKMEETNSFDLLELTGGSLHTDSYEFVKPILKKGGLFEIDCFLRGWRHYNSEDVILSNKTKLFLEAEDENKFDNNAVCVLKTPDNKKIGYVPAFYSSFVKTMLAHKIDIDVNYEFFAEAVSQYKVRMYLKGEIPQSLASQLNADLFLLA
ncbi:HIRAN domain-containing protein [Enterococcus lactis]|uniref:HIRAN domain-containing protein n=1 Tax=Enterococcus lactis TaxID=357441 RepID=UPI003D95C50D